LQLDGKAVDHGSNVAKKVPRVHVQAASLAPFCLVRRSGDVFTDDFVAPPFSRVSSDNVCAAFLEPAG